MLRKLLARTLAMGLIQAAGSAAAAPLVMTDFDPAIAHRLELLDRARRARPQAPATREAKGPLHATIPPLLPAPARRDGLPTPSSRVA